MFFKKQYEHRRDRIAVGIGTTEQSQQQQVISFNFYHNTCHFNLTFGFKIGHFNFESFKLS